jgi:hypothetical protein
LLIISLIAEHWIGISEGVQIFVEGGWPLFARWIGVQLADPMMWLSLYLVMVVSNSMLPSQADRRQWKWVLIIFGLFYLILVGLNLFALVLRWLTPIVIDVSNELIAIIGIAAVVNGAGWSFLLVVEAGLLVMTRVWRRILRV